MLTCPTCPDQGKWGTIGLVQHLSGAVEVNELRSWLHAGVFSRIGAESVSSNWSRAKPRRWWSAIIE